MDLSSTPPDYNPFASPPAPEEFSKPAPRANPPAGLGRTTEILLSLILTTATVLVIFLLLRLGSMKTRLDLLEGEAATANARAIALQAKLDQLNTATAAQEQFRAAMRQAQGLWIVSAMYGSGARFADVTSRVNELLHAPGGEFNAHPDSLGADPTPGWNKTLVIIYEVNGQRHMFSTGEGGRVTAAALGAVADH